MHLSDGFDENIQKGPRLGEGGRRVQKALEDLLRLDPLHSFQLPGRI